MEKRRQIEAINGEFELPEPVIHRVQSFLTAKEAARTAILSKSWCSAWSTRPIIDLDSYDFGGDEDADSDSDSDSDSEFNEFMEFSKKTIQRYEQSNLKIESFSIRTENLSMNVNDYSDFVNEMVTRALRIGATLVMINPYDTFPMVVLSNEMFEAENLVGLSVRNCKIEDLGLDRKVRCSKLKTLCLYYVKMNSAMICNIASCCPLIEKLSLCNISSFSYVGDYNYSFLSDLSSKFPSLKDLTLGGCTAQEVSSHTLERLKFVVLRERGFNAVPRDPGLSVKFNVPSIRKFVFVGDDDIFPSLSFVSVSREWESYVSWSHDRSGHSIISTSWFCELNKFLTVLSLSKIHLSLDINSNTSFGYTFGDIRGLSKPEVENLAITFPSLQDLSCYILFDGLFKICRPKVITLYLWSKLIFRGGKTNNLLCTTLLRGLDEKSIFGLHDLEEVNVQLFDQDVHVWCPLTLESLLYALTSAERWKSFLDASVSPKGKQKIRFQLKWKTQNAKTV